MKLVVPTITAKEAHQFRQQTELVASISDYAHLDLSSSDFFKASPSLDYSQTYLEPVLTYSAHLMYLKPLEAVKFLLAQPVPPRLIILQAEADSKDLLEAIKFIKDAGVLLGLALLQSSAPSKYSEILKMADQALIFSGNLGEHGGSADLTLLSKVEELKAIKPELEIAWDGGIKTDNILELSKAGVDVFYVGGEVHNAEDPYSKLVELQQKVESTISA